MPTTRLAALRDTMAAIFALLNVSALTAIAPGGVHHGQADPNELRDYVLLQAPTALPWDAMQSPGEEQMFQVAGVSAAPDYGPSLALVGVAIELLDGERPILPNHLCVALRWQTTQVVPDPQVINGQTTWRAVATFRMLVDEAA